MKAKGKGALKVVAHQRDGRLLKGYTEVLQAPDLEALIRQEPVALPRMISLRLAEGRKSVSIPLSSLKALFFVKSFEGRKEYQEIKFFDTHPQVEGLWVRMTFYDKEGTEGLVRNSLDLLMNPGFFVKPPDPESNNQVLYVLKASLIEFQVLGVTAAY